MGRLPEGQTDKTLWAGRLKDGQKNTMGRQTDGYYGQTEGHTGRRNTMNRRQTCQSQFAVRCSKYYLVFQFTQVSS